MKLTGKLKGKPYRLRASESEIDFKVGTRVVYTSGAYKTRSSNPLWGSMSSPRYVVGTVAQVGD